MVRRLAQTIVPMSDFVVSMYIQDTIGAPPTESSSMSNIIRATPNTKFCRSQHDRPHQPHSCRWSPYPTPHASPTPLSCSSQKPLDLSLAFSSTNTLQRTLKQVSSSRTSAKRKPKPSVLLGVTDRTAVGRGGRRDEASRVPFTFPSLDVVAAASSEERARLFLTLQKRRSCHERFGVVSDKSGHGLTCVKQRRDVSTHFHPITPPLSPSLSSTMPSVKPLHIRIKTRAHSKSKPQIVSHPCYAPNASFSPAVEHHTVYSPPPPPEPSTLPLGLLAFQFFRPPGPMGFDVEAPRGHWLNRFGG